MTKQLAILIALAAGSMQAQTAVAKIPFAFKVGTVEQPAGEYSFSSANGILRVVPADHHRSGVIVSAVNEDRPADARIPGGLEFRRYGSRYHLSRMWGEGQQDLRVQMSVDREERAHLDHSTFVVIAVTRR